MLKNPLVEDFVQRVHDCKITAERNMQRRWDKAILNMRESKFKAIASKETH